VTTAALRFVVSQPGITTALVGMTTKQHVDQAVAAVRDFQPYGPGHVETLKEQIQQQFDQLCTGCGYCLPCPEGVQVPQLMDAWNQKALHGQDGVAGRLKWHWKLTPAAAEACVECGLCEQRCTQSLPIVERLKEIAALDESA
jgi:hypothetical protein